MNHPDDFREELLRLRALVAADKLALDDIDALVGTLYKHRGVVLTRYQDRQSRLRSLEVAHYAAFAADAAAEAVQR